MRIVDRAKARTYLNDTTKVVNSNIFDLKSSVLFPPFEVGSSMLNVRSSDFLHLIIRNSAVRHSIVLELRPSAA
jgi:hypothetical protein